MSDRFANHSTGLTGPAENVEVVDYASGNVTLTQPSRYLKSSGSGILKVDTVGGQINVSLVVVPGVNHERVTRVYQSGSTAGLTINNCY